MSGTSLDGIDAALVEVRGDDPGTAACEVEAFVTVPYDAAQRDRIRAAAEGRATTPEICRLHRDLGAWLAAAARGVCDEAGMPAESVAAIGSHGQTVWHAPPGDEAGGAEDAREGASLQLGSPAVVAERTGAPVISDFRSADLAAGGHGAPLVPFADRLLFAHPERRRALQNLGGMANVTLLPPRGADEPLLAFDTGPGVALLDAAAERATGGRFRFDEDGRMAARGSVDEALLERLLRDPFLDRPPPRSTGRERFGAERVESLAQERGLEPGRPDDGWPDLLATLTAFTARTIGDAYRRWVAPRRVDDVFLTGGGGRNPTLTAAIREALDPLPVRPAEELGVDPDAREAVAFAVLAWAHLKGIPANVPEATGARGLRVLGSLTPAGSGSEAARPVGGRPGSGSSARSAGGGGAG